MLKKSTTLAQRGVTVLCPTCELANHSARCVCGGTGTINVDLEKFDGFEIWPVILYTTDFQPVPYGDPRGVFFEPLSDDLPPSAFGLYGHLVEGHCDHIADFRTRDAAEDFAALIEALAAKYQCATCEQVFSLPADAACPYCHSGNYVLGCIDDRDAIDDSWETASISSTGVTPDEDVAHLVALIQQAKNHLDAGNAETAKHLLSEVLDQYQEYLALAIGVRTCDPEILESVTC